MNPYRLFLEFILGLIGTGYFISGKKNGKWGFMGCGIALGLFPYFVANLWLMLLLGGSFLALPFFIREE